MAQQLSVTFHFDTQAELTSFLAGLPGAGAAAASTPASTSARAGKSSAAKEEAPAAYKAKHTQAEMTAALTELKEKLGLDAARNILKEHGYEKMKDVSKAEDIDAIYADAKAALEKAGEEEM